MQLKNLVRTVWPSNGQLINNVPLNNEWGITLSKDEITEGTTNYSVLAERFLDTYATSCLPSAGHSGTYDVEWLNKDLKFLSNKLEAVRKTITSWDAYHISQVVSTEDELWTGLSSLVENSSLLVNIPSPVYRNDTAYAMGDIVYCDLNRNQHIIHSLPSGFYYPSAIVTSDNSNNVSLQWRYSTTTPTPSSTNPPALSNTPSTIPYTDITATIPQRNEPILYNWRCELQPQGHEGDFITFNIESGILPDIYFYEFLGSDNELVFGEQYYLPADKINIHEGKITITNPTHIVLSVFVR